jgi:hypothetical protein
MLPRIICVFSVLPFISKVHSFVVFCPPDCEFGAFEAFDGAIKFEVAGINLFDIDLIRGHKLYYVPSN